MFKKYLPFALLLLVILVGVTTIISRSHKAEKRLAEEAQVLEESQDDEKLIEYCQVTEHESNKVVLCTPVPDSHYEAFSVTIPSDWEIEEKNVGEHVLNLYNPLKYSITIRHLDKKMSCQFNDVNFINSSTDEIDYRQDNFVEFFSPDNTYRRVLAKRDNQYSNQAIFTLCIQNQSEKTFTQANEIGHIQYITPKEFDEKEILQLDEVVKTISRN